MEQEGGKEQERKELIQVTEYRLGRERIGMSEEQKTQGNGQTSRRWKHDGKGEVEATDSANREGRGERKTGRGGWSSERSEDILQLSSGQEPLLLLPPHQKRKESSAMQDGPKGSGFFPMFLGAKRAAAETSSSCSRGG